MTKDDNGWWWVPVEWMLNNLTYSDDFDDPTGYPSMAHFWATMIESKALDAGFMSVVESLQTHGWMAPVIIRYEDFGDGPEVSLQDGHHRFVAAILLCMDMVPLHIGNTGQRAKRLKGCPVLYAEPDEIDEDSLLVEVL